MSIRKGRLYQTEFKESSVKLALDSDKPIPETAEALGIKISTLRSWIKKYSNSSEEVSSIESHYVDKIRRIEKELVQVKLERDLLKKAAAYFARESQ